jgi:hypothetical protein
MVADSLSTVTHRDPLPSRKWVGANTAETFMATASCANSFTSEGARVPRKSSAE